MRHKYFDIVSGRKQSRVSAEDFRRALRQAGCEPNGPGAFVWNSIGESDKGSNFNIYLLAFSEPCALFSNTRSLTIKCPNCGTQMTPCEWHGLLNNWRASGNTGSKVALKCCGVSADIAALHYDPPVYFTEAAVTLCAPESAPAPLDFITRLQNAVGEPLACIERIC
ncbi:MAG: hypothetical protein WC712_02675 [Candidatus Brocadiia bacterium]